MTDYAIWWLTQEDCETLGNPPPEYVPEYIRREYWHRLGRAGRGRLWEPTGLNSGVAVDPWPDTLLALAIAEHSYGGIIIRAADVQYVACLPGFVTDTRLNYWSVPTPEADND